MRRSLGSLRRLRPQSFMAAPSSTALSLDALGVPFPAGITPQLSRAPQLPLRRHFAGNQWTGDGFKKKTEGDDPSNFASTFDNIVDPLVAELTKLGSEPDKLKKAYIQLAKSLHPGHPHLAHDPHKPQTCPGPALHRPRARGREGFRTPHVFHVYSSLCS